MFHACRNLCTARVEIILHFLSKLSNNNSLLSQEDAVKTSLAHRFRRLYVLHHCTLAWAYESRMAKAERQQQQEGQQRKACIARFLSRVTDASESRPGSDLANPSVHVPPASTPSKNLPKPWSGGPHLATAVRAASRRAAIKAAAGASSGINHQPTTALGPGISEIESHSSDQAQASCVESDVVIDSQQPALCTGHFGCNDLQSGRTYHLVKRMRQQLKDRHLSCDDKLGTPSAHEGPETPSLPDDKAASVCPHQAVSTPTRSTSCHAGVHSTSENDAAPAPTVQCVHQPSASESRVTPSSHVVAQSRSVVTVTAPSRRRTMGSIPPTSRSPAPRRQTTGNLTSSPSSCTGAAVGVKRSSSASRASASVPPDRGTGSQCGQEGLAKAKSLEALQRRRTAVRRCG